MIREIKRGDVYWAKLPKLEDGSNIQWGWRPVIITSNCYACQHSPVVQYIPITSKVNKCRLPVHVPLQSDIFLEPSVALVEQEGCIDKYRLKEYMGTISNFDLMKIDIATLKQRQIDINKLYDNIKQYSYV